MPDTINLSKIKPVAKGRKRFVFEHPNDKRLLIKVSRNAKPMRCKKGLKDYFRYHYQRYSYISGFTREIREYVLSYYCKKCPLNSHLQQIIGFVDTDLGLGLVVGALQDSEGNLAPNLRSLIKENKMTADRKAKLMKLFDKIMDSELIVGDLNVRNIVLACNVREGEKFYLVDGLGDKTFIPLQRWIKWLRDHYKKKRINKLVKRIEAIPV